MYRALAKHFYQMREANKVIEDQTALINMAEGAKMCYMPQSKMFNRFLEDEVYHFADRDGCIEAEQLRDLFEMHWFEPTINKYGFSVKNDLKE